MTWNAIEERRKCEGGKQEEHKGIGEAIDGFDQTDANSSTTTTTDTSTAVDSNTALKNFLNSIPISSIPNIQNKNFHVVQLKIEDTLKDAIKIMLQKNVYCAPIVDTISSSSHDAAIATKKATNRYIGFLSFPTMVLWCLEAMEKNGCFNGKGRDGNHAQKNGFFCLLEQNSFVSKTKAKFQIRELAKSFLWDPFFPVNLEDDTLIRALLLFSKHRIHVLPVTDKTSTEITGFITRNALLELLLQSSGLEWFDKIGNTPLSEFRYYYLTSKVYGNQSVWDALRALWKNKASVVAIVKRGSEELVGSFRSFDIHLLLDNDELFSSIRSTTMSEFVELDSARKGDANTETSILERNPHGFMSAGDLCLETTA
ncbi:hypothetical protein V2J09_002160 [Rumex salicifolius]